MDFPVALIFLMLSAVAHLVHTNNECKTMLCDCQLSNVEVLKQLVDVQIRAALANVPGITIIINVGLYALNAFDYCNLQ